VDEIGSGTHERFIVAWDRFNRGVAAKAAKVQNAGASQSTSAP
jgi:predicted thioesterase